MDGADLEPQGRGREGTARGRAAGASLRDSLGLCRAPRLPVGLEGPRSEARKDRDTVGSRGPVLSSASLCPESV